MVKTTKYEKEGVTAMREAGYHTVRMPASGGGTTYHLPDFIVGQPVAGMGKAILWNCEHKSTRKDRLYVPKRELAQVEQFSRDFGGIPNLVVRWVDQTGGREHYFYRVDALRDSGKSYVAERETALDDARFVLRPNTGNIIRARSP